MFDLNSIASQLKKSRCDAAGIHELLKKVLKKPAQHNLTSAEVALAKKLNLVAKDIATGIVKVS